MDDPRPAVPAGPVDRDALAWALHHLAVSMAAVDTVVARGLSMSSTDYLAMKHLVTSGTPLGPAELGRLLGMSSGATTALVDRLERAGHVERRPHPHDRRRLVLVPSAATTAAIAEALQPLADHLDRLQQDLDAGERRVVSDFLARIERAFDDVRRAGS